MNSATFMSYIDEIRGFRLLYSDDKKYYSTYDFPAESFSVDEDDPKGLLSFLFEKDKFPVNIFEKLIKNENNILIAYLHDDSELFVRSAFDTITVRAGELSCDFRVLSFIEV